MLIVKKPTDDTKLTFNKMGAKPKKGAPLKVAPNKGGLQNAAGSGHVQNPEEKDPQGKTVDPQKKAKSAVLAQKAAKVLASKK